jgi:hypothetical protein
MPPDDWANARLAQLGEKWKQSTPPSVLYSPPSPLPQPDISAGIVYPNEISLLIANNSEAAIRDISVLVLLWDLDNLGEPISNLPISVTMKDEVIQKHTWLVPYSLAGNPSVKNQIKKGDRIFGFITVGCGECVDTKVLWVYAVQGEGGWYHQLTKGEPMPAMNTMGRHIKDIAENPELYLTNTVPVDKRTPIPDLP